MTLHVAIAVLGGTTGGPATYGRRLVEALRSNGAAKLTVLTDTPEPFAAMGVDVLPLPMRGGIDRLRWQYWALPRALRRLRPDVYHDTKNALPFGLRCPGVVTVHDLAYHTVPGSFGWASRSFLRAATRHAVRSARAVIVPSQATAIDLRRFHPECGERVHVVPHGIDPAPSLPATALDEVHTRLRLPEHYVLHVGTVQARKNVDLVVAGVRKLRARGFPHHTVLVGRQGWLAASALDAIAGDDHTTWLRHVSAADLAAIYTLADAFVSPSAYEGFGLAVADALAAGAPTVISDVSSLPELCGDAAVQLRELSADAVAEALASVLGDPARAAALRTAGRERARAFTWQGSAEGHLRAYTAAARSASTRRGR